MIRYIYNKEIDVVKYNACIAHSKQSRVYAFSWYLDIVTDNWDVLVLNDYEAVMPLPWKKKYFIKYISQPFFTQQLGIFSVSDLDTKVLENFIKNLPRRFLKIVLHFNSDNKVLFKNTFNKDNYTLALNIPYKELFKGFSKGRKHAIQKGRKNNLPIKEVQFEGLLTIAKEHYLNKELKTKDYQKIKKLMAFLPQKANVIIKGVEDKGVLIGGSVFVVHSNRIIYLFSAMTEKGKKEQLPSLLLNSIIEMYAETDFILDFEGSMIPSVASFFKSFGAKNEPYAVLRKRLV